MIEYIKNAWDYLFLDVSINTSMAILVHMSVNAVIFCVSICRLGKMEDVLFRVKLQYVLLMVAAAANGLSPMLFKQWPTTASIFFALVVGYVLLSDNYQWRRGAPEEAKTTPGELQ